MGLLFAKVAGVWEPVGSVPPAVQSVAAGVDTVVDATNPSYPILSSTAGINEVTIAATAPTDTSELWVVPPGVRPESVLYVKDGTGWDYIGGNEATLTNQRLDALQVALDREPRGVVIVGPTIFADGAVLNPGSVIGTLTFTTIVGRRYRVACDVRAMTPNVTHRGYFNLTRGGVGVGERWFHFSAGMGYIGPHCEWIIDGNGVSQAITVTLGVDTGVTLTCYSSGGATYLEDLGAV